MSYPIGPQMPPQAPPQPARTGPSTATILAIGIPCALAALVFLCCVGTAFAWVYTGDTSGY